MPRVFSSAGVVQLNEHNFHAGVHVLAGSLSATPPDVVIGVARGGMPLAHALAERLCRPAAMVCASHNRGDRIRQQATGIVDVDFTAAALLDHGLRVLLCDDIYGTGATLSAVSAALNATVFPRTIDTATLCRNEGAAGHPGRWLWDVRDWVVFPWEPPAAASEPSRLTPPSRVRRQP